MNEQDWEPVFKSVETTRQAGCLVEEAGPLGEYNLCMERDTGNDLLEFSPNITFIRTGHGEEKLIKIYKLISTIKSV